MSAAHYYVQTWDTYANDFSPQPGVRTGPYTLWGLRAAIRKLREYGYPCDYRGVADQDGKVWDHSGDPSVLIFRAEKCKTP